MHESQTNWDIPRAMCGEYRQPCLRSSAYVLRKLDNFRLLGEPYLVGLMFACLASKPILKDDFKIINMEICRHERAAKPFFRVRVQKWKIMGAKDGEIVI